MAITILNFDLWLFFQLLALINRKTTERKVTKKNNGQYDHYVLIYAVKHLRYITKGGGA